MTLFIPKTIIGTDIPNNGISGLRLLPHRKVVLPSGHAIQLADDEQQLLDMAVHGIIFDKVYFLYDLLGKEIRIWVEGDPLPSIEITPETGKGHLVTWWDGRFYLTINDVTGVNIRTGEKTFEPEVSYTLSTRCLGAEKSHTFMKERFVVGRWDTDIPVVIPDGWVLYYQHDISYTVDTNGNDFNMISTVIDGPCLYRHGDNIVWGEDVFTIRDGKIQSVDAVATPDYTRDNMVILRVTVMTRGHTYQYRIR